MTRSYDEIEKLTRDAGVPRRSPIGRLIMTTAENLNAAETQITAKISFLRDHPQPGRGAASASCSGQPPRQTSSSPASSY